MIPLRPHKDEPAVRSKIKLFESSCPDCCAIVDSRRLFSHGVIMFPDTFISVEMITLRPQRDEPAVSYPGFHMLCSLDTIKIQSSGCQLESVTRVPHTCNMTQDYDYVTENEIESTIEHGTGFGHLDDDLFPQKEPRATPNVSLKLSYTLVTIKNIKS